MDIQVEKVTSLVFKFELTQGDLCAALDSPNVFMRFLRSQYDGAITPKGSATETAKVKTRKAKKPRRKYAPFTKVACPDCSRHIAAPQLAKHMRTSHPEPVTFIESGPLSAEQVGSPNGSNVHAQPA